MESLIRCCRSKGFTVYSGPSVQILRLNMIGNTMVNVSYTKVSAKMTYANSADPDQTAPEGAV